MVRETEAPRKALGSDLERKGGRGCGFGAGKTQTEVLGALSLLESRRPTIDSREPEVSIPTYTALKPKLTMTIFAYRPQSPRPGRVLDSDPRPQIPPLSPTGERSDLGIQKNLSRERVSPLLERHQLYSIAKSNTRSVLKRSIPYGMIHRVRYASTTTFTWTPNCELCNAHRSFPSASLLTSSSSHKALEPCIYTCKPGHLPERETAQPNATWLNRSYRRFDRRRDDPIHPSSSIHLVSRTRRTALAEVCALKAIHTMATLRSGSAQRGLGNEGTSPSSHALSEPSEMTTRSSCK